MGQTPSSRTLHMRSATLEDEAGIARACLMTANSGTDASALYSRPDLPALIWATPYLHHSPRHCFVVEHDQEVVGFIVSTPNTRHFENWARAHWWPEVERKLFAFKPRTAQDKNALAIIKAMRQPAPDYADSYPAHLHINLLPQVQGTGIGRKLMTAALETLKTAGAPSVHLGVALQNTKAIGFYKALGFKEIEQSGALILGKDLE
ncbi:GNAT family N-acetyltransferase [uncultured Maritalea sp.]|uniref:GNAT family N-acetyltransferase n=1 Tax=uncultured Maritalea sp. TaxID=757249 RepID=UPI00263920FC|nr:GNAT family N-acetyltransferase [uncultured Maritalea sp.]